jgi:multiple sugar transport system ATP-binding protein
VPDVRFEGVRKAFGAAVAVKGLDLTIAEGEFVSLLGPSGCGKTTTLRMLAGLEFPTAGTIRIGERVVNDVAPGARDIAMVFQSYALYPHMTVGENIAYPLKKRRVGRAEREAKVKAVAETLQIVPLLDRKPRQLSGGQQQRVALGRALVRDPVVFLLDEPLSNLDAKLRAHMRAELIELHRKVGKTFIYVTHDQLEAMTMSSRIAVMHEGALQQYGTPKEVYETPANRVVAGFIGTPAMNMFEGRIERAGGEAVFRHAAVTVPVSLDAAPSGPVLLGARPEDVVLGAGPIATRVRVVEPTGHETIVMLEAPDAGLTVRAAPDMRLEPGATLAVDLKSTRLHLFDATTGARLDARFGPARSA